MGVSALDPTGEAIIATNVPVEMWESWKGGATAGQFRMECCGATAVAKTSPAGLQFFAHVGDECATAPETIWHLGAKALIVDAMRSLGATCDEEVLGEGVRPWRADVFVRTGDRRIAIEIQRSYQHLREFMRRQRRYCDVGVECVWLLPRDGYHRLAKATTRSRWEQEFGRSYPQGEGPCLRELPVAALADPEIPEITGAGLFRVSLDVWCDALLKGQLRWSGGLWIIGDDPASPISGLQPPPNLR